MAIQEIERKLQGAIDPRITLGSVLSIVAIIISISVAWANLSASQARQEERLTGLERILAREQNDHDQLVQLAADVRMLAAGRTITTGAKP